jgi:hypothetical protein
VLEVTIIELVGLSAERAYDEGSGLNLLRIGPP